MSVLVDTSVLIDYLRGHRGAAVHQVGAVGRVNEITLHGARDYPGHPHQSVIGAATTREAGGGVGAGHHSDGFGPAPLRRVEGYGRQFLRLRRS